MRPLFMCWIIMAGVIGGIALLADTASAAQHSTLDLQRGRAASLFDRRLDALSAMRAVLTDDWTAYGRACRGKMTTGRGEGVVFLRSELVWFVQALELDNESMPACRMLATGITTRSHRIAYELQQIDEEAARRDLSGRDAGFETQVRLRVEPKKRPLG